MFTGPDFATDPYYAIFAWSMVSMCLAMACLMWGFTMWLGGWAAMRLWEMAKAAKDRRQRRREWERNMAASKWRSEQ